MCDVWQVTRVTPGVKTRAKHPSPDHLQWQGGQISLYRAPALFRRAVITPDTRHNGRHTHPLSISGPAIRYSEQRTGQTNKNTRSIVTFPSGGAPRLWCDLWQLLATQVIRRRMESISWRQGLSPALRVTHTGLLLVQIMARRPLIGRPGRQMSARVWYLWRRDVFPLWFLISLGAQILIKAQEDATHTAG